MALYSGKDLTPTYTIREYHVYRGRRDIGQSIAGPFKTLKNALESVPSLLDDIRQGKPANGRYHPYVSHVVVLETSKSVVFDSADDEKYREVTDGESEHVG